jgi:NAD(P)-dependent dehydrogenase (short-subunit alcohol dehydrogenase family)
MTTSIKNKVALVTGANRGIGKQIVETFLEQGAQKVYLAVRNTDSTKDLESKYGERVVTLQADVSDDASINQLATQTKDVTIVVNNAGIGTPVGTIEPDMMERAQALFDVNTLGVIRMANAFAPILEANKGAFVQLNSVASIKNFPSLSIYSASKAASYSITQGIQSELGPKGVQVLSVHPGPIDTDMAAGAGFTDVFPTKVVSEGIVNALANGEFHLFPDELAKQFEAGYQSYSDNFITTNE